MAKKTEDDWLKSYTDEWHRWQTIMRDGAGDPHWPDGMNLYLVRNHMLYYLGHDHDPPDDMPLPPEMPMDFNVKPRPPAPTRSRAGEQISIFSLIGERT